MRHYPIAPSDRSKTGRKAYAVFSGVKRAPLKGDWYISGAIPQAWYAPNDFPEESVYHIAKIVNVNE
jgi:hypothetical protein